MEKKKRRIKSSKKVKILDQLDQPLEKQKSHNSCCQLHSEKSHGNTIKNAGWQMVVSVIPTFTCTEVKLIWIDAIFVPISYRVMNSIYLIFLKHFNDVLIFI